MSVVLFTNKNSVYKKLGCDCYDLDRDALNYKGSHPVIAHPPCRLFSRMRAFSTADLEEKKLAYWTVDLVRKNGGILEHPAGSTLWIEKELPKKEIDRYGGFTISINQHWFGFPAQKRTWLYMVGLNKSQVEQYPLNFDIPFKGVADMDKRKRADTTEILALWLIKNLEIIKKNKEI